MNCNIMNPVCGILALSTGAAAIAAGCYVPVQKYCCDVLTSFPKPTQVGSCQDEITANPPISHYDNAMPNVVGSQTRTDLEPQICKWKVYLQGSGGCGYAGYSLTNTCYPITLSTPTCIGEANQ